MKYPFIICLLFVFGCTTPNLAKNTPEKQNTSSSMVAQADKEKRIDHIESLYEKIEKEYEANEQVIKKVANIPSEQKIKEDCKRLVDACVKKMKDEPKYMFFRNMLGVASYHYDMSLELINGNSNQYYGAEQVALADLKGGNLQYLTGGYSCIMWACCKEVRTVLKKKYGIEVRYFGDCIVSAHASGFIEKYDEVCEEYLKVVYGVTFKEVLKDPDVLKAKTVSEAREKEVF